MALVHAVVSLLQSQERIASMLRENHGLDGHGALSRPGHAAFLKRLANSRDFMPLEVDLLSAMSMCDVLIIPTGIPNLVSFINPGHAAAAAAATMDQSDGVSGSHASTLTKAIVQGYNFSLAAVAGAIGATFVYPIGKNTTN